MRIISDFKDYYDCFQSQSEPIYIRKTEEEEIKIKERTFFSQNIYRCVNNKTRIVGDIRTCIVGFCGDIFGCCLDYREIPSRPLCKDRYFFFNQAQLEAEKNEWKGQDLDYSSSPFSCSVGFNLTEDFKSKFKQYFSSTCPIWIISRVKEGYGIIPPGYINLVRNPCLKYTNFVNHFGLQDTFQRIEMYLSNIAHPNKPIPYVSDEDLIGAKGFDKFSFRKDKATPKK